MGRIALLAGLLVLMAPTSALAAVARIEVKRDGSHGEARALLFVEASAGERNRLAVTQATGGSWLVHDDSAPVTAGAGCANLDGSTARCVAPQSIPVTSLSVDAGDLDDVVVAPELTYADIEGGPGDDVLRGGGSVSGGPGADTIDGGALPDRLFGGAGDDVLRGGDANDILFGDDDGGGIDRGGGADRLDGGAGLDVVSYERRAGPVAVDLADSAADGAPGERDVLVNVEGVTGGAGNDVLVGDQTANELAGGAGDDRLYGQGGNDRLTGDRGRDLLLGAAGADTLHDADPGDRVSGGDGADFLASLGAGVHLDSGPGDDRITFFSRPASVACGSGSDAVSGRLDGLRLDDCESVFLGAFDLFKAAVHPTRRSRDVFRVAVRCRARGTTNIRRCRGTVTLRLRRSGGAPITLGSRAFSIVEAHHASVRVHVRRRGREALRTSTRPLVEVEVSGAGIERPKYHAPGGVDTTPRFAGRWRTRLHIA